MFHFRSLCQYAAMRLSIALLLAACLVPCASLASSDRDTVPDLNGVLVRPLSNHGQKASLFLFITTDCPIVNAYAAEMERICAAYKRKGISSYLVYTDNLQSAKEDRHHADAFKLRTAQSLRDAEHLLVKRFGAAITPQAAVALPGGRCVYLGRIDDRFVDFGKARYRPTTRDLRDALDAVLAGRRPAPAVGRAIGCYISNK